MRRRRGASAIARAVALQEARRRTRRDADENEPTYIGWAAKLHEIGISVAYSGYHKHSAYILEKADMPGFSRDEQTQVALLVLAHRRSLKKVIRSDRRRGRLRSVLALRLAALFYRGRTDIALPISQAKAQGNKFRLGLDAEWLARNPLTATALREEIKRVGEDRLRAEHTRAGASGDGARGSDAGLVPEKLRRHHRDHHGHPILARR